MPDSALQPVVCCLGQPLAGHPAQFVMERAFAAAGLDWRYLTLEVDSANLPDAVRGLRALGFRGANIVAPHKAAVCSLVDETTELAAHSGIVTCVVQTAGRLKGENSEGAGFLAHLSEFMQPSGKRVLLFGAGAAGRSIAVALALAGVAELVLINRHEQRAVELAEKVNQLAPGVARVEPWTAEVSIQPEIDLVVNATSLGQYDEGCPPVLADSLRPELIAADVVMTPLRTHWLRMAQEHGCSVMDGLGLLIHHLAISFQLWTNQAADVRLMRDAAEEFLDI